MALFPASGGGGSKIVKLWENPSPTSAMVGGEYIDVNTSGYDLYMMIYAPSATGGVNSVTAKVGENMLLCYSAASNAGADTADRTITYTSSSRLTVSDAYRSQGTGTKTLTNSVLIPRAIYGIKL